MKITELIISTVLLIVINTLNVSAQGQSAKTSERFNKLREVYIKHNENDTAAFKYLQVFIDHAKNEKNYRQLSRGYIDAIYYSKKQKLFYADSAISAAKLSRRDDFIARAHLAKGSVYYFNFKQYQKALSEYLTAHKYAEKTNDSYLQNRIDYQLAITKGYLGYYGEAILLLEDCIKYFEAEYNKQDSHLNTKVNHQKGYLNSLHQLAQFHHHLGNEFKVDSLVKLGLRHTPSTEDFSLEQSYFYKLKGIHFYSIGDYPKALEYLKKSKTEIVRINDFGQLSIIHFYTGKSFINAGDEDEGLIYLKKVDSIFNKEKFLLPELRSTYELLIAHHHKNKDIEKELYYTNQLLKADKYFLSDFRFLSQKISKDYDNYNLMEENKILITQSDRNLFILSLCFAVMMILIIVIYYQRIKQKKIVKNYKKIIENIQTETNLEKPQTLSIPKSKTNLQNTDILKEILQKLAFFESSEKFLDSDLTQAKLATYFKTNTSYLSQIINEFKAMNYNDYINTLRINYITKQLYTDKKYLNYSIEALAEKSGFSSRQVFSNVFFKINNLRPKDFIVNRKNELNGSNTENATQ